VFEYKPYGLTIWHLYPLKSFQLIQTSFLPSRDLKLFKKKEMLSIPRRCKQSFHMRVSNSARMRWWKNYICADLGSVIHSCSDANVNNPCTGWKCFPFECDRASLVKIDLINIFYPELYSLNTTRIHEFFDGFNIHLLTVLALNNFLTA
jgi:hypothetical protein